MSSYGYTAIVQANSDGNNNKVNIDLIRLLAKVNITVTNATAKDITIEQLTMGKFRHTGDIFLLPYDVGTSDDGKGNLLVDKGSENKLLNPSFPEETLGESESWQLPEKANHTVIAEQNESYMFYINETAQGNQGTNGEDMTISLKIKDLNRDSEPQNTNFFFVRRNDLLEVPILVSNAQMTIKFDQKRMPIGGIPESIVFPQGAIFANKQLTTSYLGDIVITYELDLEELHAKKYELSYYNNGPYNTGKRYCSAVLQKQTNNLLLEPAEKVILGPDTDPSTLNAPWLSAADGLYGYKLTPDTEDPETTGSFTITAQELSNAGTATIKLTLVAEVTKDGNTSQVILPYTLTIKNGKSEKGE